MVDRYMRVLLVEDNPGDVCLIKELLSDAKMTSFKIEVAERLSDGLDALSARRFDVVLLDLSLPESSGLETLTKMHSNAQQVAIIVLTGLSEEGLAIEAVRKGAQDYLVKGQIDENLLPRSILYATERKRAEEALREKAHELGERFKELNCLYGISRLRERPGISFADILQGIIDLIPPAWQYPEITCARVILNGQIFATKNFKETIWRQASDITVHGDRAGSLGVCYLEERPESDEGPFLKEERSLINAIAERLGRIIEHEQAEEALQESEKKYKTLTENSLTGVLIHQDGKYVFVNDRFAEIHGYKPEEMIGKDHLTFVHPDQRKIVKQRASQRIRGEAAPQCYELQRLRKDGVTIWCETMVTRIEYRGRPAIMGNMIYINDRKKAEEALQESEARYRSVFENTGTATVIIEEDMTISMANTEFEKLSGYVKEELEGKMKWTRFAVKEDLERMKEYHVKRRANEGNVPIEYEFRFIDRQGNIKDIFIKVGMIPGTKRSITSLLDISSRKRSEEALRESEERYRTLVECARDVIYTVSQDATIASLNPAFETITGWSCNEWIGKDLASIVHPDDLPLAMEMGQRVLCGERAPIHEVRIRSKSGEYITVEFTITPLMYNDSVVGILGVGRDVTERKKLEAQLHQVQKAEALGILAGGIAHNFNNLLMAIMGNTSLMLLETDSSHPNYERLEIIEKSVQSGSRLTRQLLGYAREGRYEIKPISFNQLIEETSNTFGETKREITVHQDLAQDLWGIRADQGQIEQTLLNLYVNAADAMPGGGDLFLKTINVTHKDMRGKPYKAKSGDYVLLTVRDTGTGMDKKTMDLIFDPFFTTKGMGRGTGLGLASVYGIVKAHGGYIDVESKKGGGTTFSIYLPASERKVEKPVKSAEQMVKGDGTILLVDDEEMVLDVGVQLLKTLGYAVLEAKGGREAVEIYREKKDKIDMVLLDMIMPDMGGGEAYDRMKEINPNVKVLLSSGYSINGQATEILERGCDSFIQKPFNMKELSQKVWEILDKR